ncbi:unnamed protein product [Cochlearia groenlandica]
MTKLAVLVAIFVVLFLGMVTKETEAQHICHKILLTSNCDGPTCTDLCDRQLHGTGQCVLSYDKRFICLCNWDCRP